MANSSDLLIRRPLEVGENVIVAPGEMEYLGLSVIKLDEGGSQSLNSGDRELALVVLTGTATVEVEGARYENIGGRGDVFSANAASVYVPCGSGANVSAPGPGPVQVAVCSAPSSLKRAPAYIAPADVKVKAVGKANWRRSVKDIIDYTFEAQHLVLGETVNVPGNWSSYPPHKHEVDNLPVEAKMEEIYFFQVKPQDGFGFQRVYTDDRSLDETYTIEHNDTVKIPKGYHPVSAAPGVPDVLPVVPGGSEHACVASEGRSGACVDEERGADSGLGGWKEKGGCAG